MTDIDQQITEIGRRARIASQAVANTSGQRKNEALLAMALELEASAFQILSANRLDLESASHAGSALAMLDRLRLDETRVASMARGVREVAVLPDPVGETLCEWDRPNHWRCLIWGRASGLPGWLPVAMGISSASLWRGKGGPFLSTFADPGEEPGLCRTMAPRA